MTDTIAPEKLDRVTYCGGWCGSCIVGNGWVRTTAAAMATWLDRFGYEYRARSMTPAIPAAASYASFRGVLDWLCGEECPGCRRGATVLWGDPGCDVRDCARERGLIGCWDCPGEAGCSRLAPLDAGDPAGPARRARIREVGLRAWVAEQEAVARDSFPCRTGLVAPP